MTEGIGGYVRDKREEMGLSPKEFGAIAGVTKGYLSTLEAGKIGLPAPAVRRRLAKALGVSHLDLLVAAGEITEDEVGEVGAVGVIERDADSPRERRIARIRALPDNVEAGLELAILYLEAQAGK